MLYVELLGRLVLVSVSDSVLMMNFCWYQGGGVIPRQKSVKVSIIDRYKYDKFRQHFKSFVYSNPRLLTYFNRLIVHVFSPMRKKQPGSCLGPRFIFGILNYLNYLALKLRLCRLKYVTTRHYLSRQVKKFSIGPVFRFPSHETQFCLSVSVGNRKLVRWLNCLV